MGDRFSVVSFAAAEPEIRRHLRGLPLPVEAFVEEHLLAARHYRITVDGDFAGIAAIHASDSIRLFALEERHWRDGQRIFAQLRRLEQVQRAFVPTCDPVFMAHAIEGAREIAPQAYFFVLPPGRVAPAIPAGDVLRLATPDDWPLIREESGDFFGDIERLTNVGQLFVMQRHGEPVGFGLMELSVFLDNVASIGMFTRETSRNTGVGRSIIALLVAECQRRGLRPVAGCWYYNHGSKRTLESAGLATPTRLLKVEY